MIEGVVQNLAGSFVVSSHFTSVSVYYDLYTSLKRDELQIPFYPVLICIFVVDPVICGSWKVHFRLAHLLNGGKPKYKKVTSKTNNSPIKKKLVRPTKPFQKYFTTLVLARVTGLQIWYVSLFYAVKRGIFKIIFCHYSVWRFILFKAW